ncbi:hypothetical protein MTX78_24565 (plasmid) [Hymenobacter tibetensis]|uniref:N-acetyltransferase domain-containing protein n=1 Tax=Hymenobacter tibetensis TaxID=497967 RepID=A0ABY4D6C2_9BACT|nr:hypothetical protein [Hymenobacter tibetensis]UOG77592.1 hypothetical protein MTX78_24565 [Hymenobacter tibetensis]
MSEIALRIATVADAPALANLANQYTFQQVSEVERENGFLTGSFSAVAMQAMLTSVPSQVAFHNQELVGFIINSKLPAERYPPLVKEICALLPTFFYHQLPLTQYRWFFYGPVLVKKEYRGQGLLLKLFEANKQELRGSFDIGVAFIAEQNNASLQVHTQRLGLEIVGRVVFQGVPYAILAFSLSEDVR